MKTESVCNEINKLIQLSSIEFSLPSFHHRLPEDATSEQIEQAIRTLIKQRLKSISNYCAEQIDRVDSMELLQFDSIYGLFFKLGVKFTSEQHEVLKGSLINSDIVN